MRLRSNQRGDSIVEVLIATAIISLILVGAYVTTNKNTQATQNTQERTQAQHLVEGQIEALRAQNGLKTAGECFNGASEITACNAFTEPGSGATYSVNIAGPTGIDPPSPSKYTIKVSWTSLGDMATNASNVIMVYRLN